MSVLLILVLATQQAAGQDAPSSQPLPAQQPLPRVDKGKEDPDEKFPPFKTKGVPPVKGTPRPPSTLPKDCDKDDPPRKKDTPGDDDCDPKQPFSTQGKPPPPAHRPPGPKYTDDLDPPEKPSPDLGPPGEVDVLRRPTDTTPQVIDADWLAIPYGPYPPFAPEPLVVPGFTGPSGVAPVPVDPTAHFQPVEDRWRIGYEDWDRYGKGHPWLDDYPYDKGRWYDPYHQNVLKGDYPILGQNTFFELTASSTTLIEPRAIPTATTPFESTVNPFQSEFFGKPNQFVTLEFLSVSFELFHGNAAFKPNDWRLKVTPVFNSNNLAVSELAVINPDVRKGTQRERTFFALQEFFVEKKIADLSPHYDFLSVRVGSQFFVSDFRGFIFNDTNLGARLFGTLEANRDQFNLVYFDQFEKDTNSGLNSFRDRDQRILIANFFRQDFIWPGFTLQASVHYNHDSPAFRFDRNNFLVRPDPVGTFQPHGLDVVYLGLAGDGHINRFNVSSALYWALGRDSHNPLANTGQDINGWMGAFELSYDRDYVRFRTSYFFSSGDGNPNNSHATGFDTILDRPNFAGTFFSYWQRQKIPLFGVGLKQELSLVPNLRASKNQGQSNFVNPGLQLFNVGFDVDLTPKLKWINNYNLLWFDKTASLETFVYQGQIDRFIGADLSMGFEYRPLLSNNVVMAFGLATLIPGTGFRDLYDRLGEDPTTLVSGFGQLTLLY